MEKGTIFAVSDITLGQTLACIVLIGISLLAGCASVSAPDDYRSHSVDRAPRNRIPNEVILPPGTLMDSKHIELLYEQDQSPSKCQFLPTLQAGSATITYVYWRETRKPAVHVTSPLPANCNSPARNLHQCLSTSLKRWVTQAIAQDKDWSACVKDVDSIDIAFPYHAKESLERAFGFNFLPVPDNSRDSLASIEVRAGMNVCMRAEVTLAGAATDLSRLPGAEQCQQVLPGPGGTVTFSRLSRLSDPTFKGLADASKTPTIQEAHGWSAIRSHAETEKAYSESLRLTLFFPATTTLHETADWKRKAFHATVAKRDANDFGPLVILSKDTIAVASRDVTYATLCNGLDRSCFLFRDLPSVRITHPIWADRQLLEAEPGMTVGDLLAASGLATKAPILLREFRGRRVPVHGDLVPVLPGDTLRSTRD